jgi:quinolinate synthase
MAETADILANRPECLARRGGRRIPVMLPDLSAGCSLADMAKIGEVEDCWRQVGEALDMDDVTPITYVNSTADLKAFCGRHGGLVCTSANARAALDWAFRQRGRVLFFPDQHLGRNTARAMGIPLKEMPLWDPRQERLGGIEPETLRTSRVILWQGHCCVHQAFLPSHVEMFRQQHPGGKVIVHPECMMSIVDLADAVGSTGKIIREVEDSPPGTCWAIGTEWHLVNRLKHDHPEQEIHFLSPVASLCETMDRIDLPGVCWAVENWAAGTPVNVMEVEPETARGALDALQRMLRIQERVP